MFFDWSIRDVWLARDPVQNNNMLGYKDKAKSITKRGVVLFIFGKYNQLSPFKTLLLQSGKLL